MVVWLKKTGRKAGFVLTPMVFMNIMTIWALVLLLLQYKFSLIGIIAGILLLLAIVLIVEACRTFKKIITAQ